MMRNPLFALLALGLLFVIGIAVSPKPNESVTNKPTVEQRLTRLESEVRNLKAKLEKHEAGSLPHISEDFWGGK